MSEPSGTLLEVKNVTRSFYGVHALTGVSLAVPGRGITGLIGPNGAGKTTLFNCISGVIPPDGGQILFDGTHIAGNAARRDNAGRPGPHVPDRAGPAAAVGSRQSDALRRPPTRREVSLRP